MSTQVIADQVGLSQAALFKRFGTKQNLMLEALAPPATPLFAEQLLAGPDDRPLAEQLAEIAEHILAFLRQILPVVAALRFCEISPLELLSRYETPPPVVALRGLTTWFEKAIADGRLRHHQPEALAMAFMGSLHARVFFQKAAPMHDWAQEESDYAASVINILLCGLLTEEIA